MQGDRYTLIQRLLHWLTALLVVLVLVCGGLFWAYGYNGLKASFGQDTTNAIYLIHKSSGVLILFVMIPRLILRTTLGAPAKLASLTPFERIASTAVQHSLYVALIAMPIVGWLATAAGGFPIEFFGTTLPGLIGKDKALSDTLYTVHSWLALVILALATLHVAGAMRHWLIKKDGLMHRMSLFG